MATDLSQYDPIFQAAGQEWNVDPTLLKAVAGQESGGNLNAVSSAGAQGLMQITPDTQKSLGITDPKDPTQQIYGAAKYLDEGLNKEGSPEGALLYYHGGPGWRQAYGPESQAYVPAVTARYAALSQAQASAAPPASSPTTAPSNAPQGASPVIVGDSLASPGGLGGSGVVGAVPGAIRSSVAADARKGTYQGQNVVLSSGASNAPGDMTNVEGQLQLLQNGGAKGVALLGVGPGVETKNPGTNGALQGLATKYGATFVPLPADQMSKDGVHPTAQGYRALRTQLASATPTTATDASAAPAAATGPGNAMASDDPLSLLPPAPKPTTGRSAAPAAPDDPLSLLPPAPQPAGAQAAPTLPGPGVPSADEQSAETGLPLPRSPPPGGLVDTSIAPGPNVAGLMPLSRDAEGNMRFALPNALRDIIGGVGVERTMDPETGKISAGTPSSGANLLLSLGAGLGGRDIQFGPTGTPPIPTFGGPLPPTAHELTAAVQRAGETTPRMAAELEARLRGNALTPDAQPVPTEGAPTAAAPTGMPVLTAEERAWAAGAQARLQEIREQNQMAGVPGDLGAAATPEQLAQLTPQQMKAYRRQAELGEALAPAPRELDKKIYVEGSTPTRAEYSADPATSQQETLERERAPNQYDPVLQGNNAARVNKFEGMMGSDIQVDDLKVAKAKAAETDGNEFLRVARPLDFTPAADWVDGQLADPRVQARPDVVKKLGELKNSLYDADGNMRTEPGYGWGLHDEAMADLEKAKDTTRAERYSKSQILQWKNIIDGVNDSASDGAFQTFLDNQSGYASQINAMDLLQKYRPKLTSGKTGMILPTAFHRFVADLAMRRGEPGIDAAMDLPDETMRGLLNIGKDLKRADNIDLGKARGSPTNLLFSLAKGTGIGMAHLGLSAATSGTGVANLLLQSAIKAGSAATGNILLRRRVNQSLAPPPGGYDYSPLQPP